MTGETFKDKLRTWQEQGQYEQVIAAISAQESGMDYELALWLALAYDQQQCFDEAIAALLQWETDGEHDPWWHIALGQAYFGWEQDDLALAQF